MNETHNQKTDALLELEKGISIKLPDQKPIIKEISFIAVFNSITISQKKIKVTFELDSNPNITELFLLRKEVIRLSIEKTEKVL